MLAHVLTNRNRPRAQRPRRAASASLRATWIGTHGEVKVVEQIVEPWPRVAVECRPRGWHRPRECRAKLESAAPQWRGPRRARTWSTAPSPRRRPRSTDRHLCENFRQGKYIELQQWRSSDREGADRRGAGTRPLTLLAGSALNWPLLRRRPEAKRLAVEAGHHQLRRRLASGPADRGLSCRGRQERRVLDRRPIVAVATPAVRAGSAGAQSRPQSVTIPALVRADPGRAGRDSPAAGCAARCGSGRARGGDRPGGDHLVRIARVLHRR